MSQNMTPRAFDDILFAIMSNVDGGAMDLQVQLYSDVLGDYPTTIMRPVNLRIAQDFLDAYTDHLLLTVEVTPDQFIDLIEHTTDLRIQVTLQYKNFNSGQEGNRILSESYMVLVRNIFKMNQFFTMEQLRKAMSAQIDLIPMQMELVKESLYKLRKREINFIARNVSISDVILLGAQILGVSKVHLVEPDNDKQYEQIVVPPMQSLKTFFRFLQETPSLGVYDTGCNYYYTDATLYVYPKWDLTPSKGFTTHFYNTATYDMLAIANRYVTDEETGDIHIAVPTIKDIENKVQKGIENVRTGRILYRSEDLIDDKADAEVTHSAAPPNKVMAQQCWGTIGKELDVAITESKRSANAKVVRSNDNRYANVSEIAEHYNNRMALEWENALPFSLKPSFPMQFHYDLSDPDSAITSADEFAVETMPCLCEKIIYNIIRSTENTAHGMLFYCQGTIQIATAPEKS